MILNQLPRMIVVATFFVGFVATTQAAPKQTICPLMIEEEIDEEEFIEYKGVKVFTCCGTCKKMWKQNPDYYAVVSVKQAPQLAAVASKTIKPMKQQFCPVYSVTPACIPRACPWSTRARRFTSPRNEPWIDSRRTRQNTRRILNRVYQGFTRPRSRGLFLLDGLVGIKKAWQSPVSRETACDIATE